MAVEKMWINISITVLSVSLLTCGLAHIGITAYANIVLSSGRDVTAGVSVAILIGLAALIFPTIWTGLCAAMSRHKGLYIMYVVLVSLSILEESGILIYQVVAFHQAGLYTSASKGAVIAILVLQGLILLLLTICLAIGIAAHCARKPEPYAQRAPGNGYHPADYFYGHKPDAVKSSADHYPVWTAPWDYGGEKGNYVPERVDYTPRWN